ncbi:SDR family NAD(P)-dependent oxidoreductase [Sphingobium sp. CFD-1]|uniref:SDR family NAD(P)-dependent oxidoreductase n=1 Tax=Sphingobium sp. CFD-1 TaxID=2878545 RepID=UPI00214BE8B7|nr:SDR family oxidoreductase [Sphingobium sp. CFD-1]
MGSLDGRVAIVTGAGEGIGMGIARRFAREGAKVVIAEINSGLGQSAVKEIAAETNGELLFVPTDVRRKDDVAGMIDAAVQCFGGVDILVNNAWGGGVFKRAEHKSDADLEYGLSMNIWAAFWAAKAALPHMRSKGWGRIISICSLNGVNAHTGTLEYNVGKEGLRALTRSIAREWAPYQICANIICPAAITTAFRTFAESSPELAAKLPTPPMGRLGDPDDDIAGVALFLASDDARYVTGNTLFADGGSHINGASWSLDLPDEE